MAFGALYHSLVVLDGSETRHHRHCLAEGEDVSHVLRHFGDLPLGRDLEYNHAVPPGPNVVAWNTLPPISNSSHSNYGTLSNYGLKSFWCESFLNFEKIEFGIKMILNFGNFENVCSNQNKRKAK